MVVVSVKCVSQSTGLHFLERTLRFLPRFLMKLKLEGCSLILQFLGNLFHPLLHQTSINVHNLFFTQQHLNLSIQRFYIITPWSLEKVPFYFTITHSCVYHDIGDKPSYYLIQPVIYCLCDFVFRCF